VVYELIIVLKCIFKKKKTVSASRLDSYGIRKVTVVESCGRLKDPCVRKSHGKAHEFSVVLTKS
jgi:hypothetical protein